MMTLSLTDLAAVHGGAEQKLDIGVPARREQQFLNACGPQIDAYSAARGAYKKDETNTRAEVGMATAGRTLALCATNNGFDPPASWRHR